MLGHFFKKKFKKIIFCLCLRKKRKHCKYILFCFYFFISFFLITNLPVDFTSFLEKKYQVITLISCLFFSFFVLKFKKIFFKDFIFSHTSTLFYFPLDFNFTFFSSTLYTCCLSYVVRLN